MSTLNEEEVSCALVEQQLLEARHPGDPPPPAFANHLEGCPRCQRFRAQILLLDDLAREQAPELPQGFQLSLRRRLEQTAKSKKEISRIDEARPISRRVASPRRILPLGARFASPRLVLLAAAAIVLVCAGALWVASRWKAQGEPLSYHRLRLAIQSTVEHQEVLFDVALPEGVRTLPATAGVLGQSGRLQWRSAVRSGVSEMDLPLVARRLDGRVRVRLTAGRKVWTGSIGFDGTIKSASSPSTEQGLRLAAVLLSDATEDAPRALRGASPGSARGELP